MGTSATLALLETIQRRRAEGRTVWDLGLGEPIFPAPPASVRAAIESAQGGDLGFFKTPARGENGDDAARFCQRLLEACDVALVPGDAFGTPLWARASYSGGDDPVREGFGRLAQYLRDYAVSPRR